MSTIRKSITFTEQQDRWIKGQIANGNFTNDSEYIRDLVRQDQARTAEFLQLKAAIQEGIDSGISEKSLNDIWEEVEQSLSK